MSTSQNAAVLLGVWGVSSEHPVFIDDDFGQFVR